MLKKSEMPAPLPLKEEVAHVPGLYGDGTVTLRGMGLTQRLQMRLDLINGPAVVPYMLSHCVLVEGDKADEKLRLWTPDEWDRWGAHHQSEVLELWNKVEALCDVNGAQARKNSNAQNSESPSA